MTNITKTIAVDKTQPKRILGILDNSFKPWLERNLPIFDTIEAELHWGYVSDNKVGRFDYMNTADGRVMLLAKPDHLSIAEAYEYIIAHLNT